MTRGSTLGHAPGMPIVRAPPAPLDCGTGAEEALIIQEEVVCPSPPRGIHLTHNENPRLASKKWWRKKMRGAKVILPQRTLNKIESFFLLARFPCL